MVPALVAAADGALYVHAANPAVGGGNSGEFQVMAYLLGIAHPPSYPLYLLLAKVAAATPLPGDVAWRINVLTALLAAGAVLLAGLLLLELWLAGSSRDARRDAALLAAALAAALAGAMPRLWSLAVEAEVFSLHLLLVLGLWLALAKWQRAPGAAGDRWLLAAALLAGLGLANHRTYLFVAAGGLLFVLVTRPATALRLKLVAACGALVLLGLSPYLYVLRGLVMPVAYFAPTDVHRLTRGEVWYVIEGNASGETGGGAIVRQLFADRPLLFERSRWLWKHLSEQFGLLGVPVATVGTAGLAGLAWRRPAWAAGAVFGAAGSAIFAMAYAKYPDGDRYLLPLETLLAMGAGYVVAQSLAALGWFSQRLRRGGAALGRAAGALCGLALGGYGAFSLGVLDGTTHYTRGGYVYFTLHNLDAVDPNADVCSWWASAWGWWYAQYVDGHRPDVALIPKGPDECVRDIVPRDFGQRPVYLPALTERVRQSPYVFFPSRDLWLAVAPRAPLAEGTLFKGPDDRIFLYEGGQRRWVPSMAVFAGRGFRWDDVRLTPDYVLKDLPEGPPLT